ncbi:hypothetical protein [Cytobacillus sp. IB215316]|uniref:hypothetical protein n=1 Tax=Cytobacillus sp. IB215316 TaxID=3097354 RepID=UPI002A15DC5E|nr:hypothetical protein [Cytobacillus sp. IB215316]MDX8360450.1 hypothetical protein [Cytobacillus sp. IB215316]
MESSLVETLKSDVTLETQVSAIGIKIHDIYPTEIVTSFSVGKYIIGKSVLLGSINLLKVTEWVLGSINRF